MPATAQFVSDDCGNGFPFCAEKLDVSVYDFWTTLGGTQKGGIADAVSIATSRMNAMKLYWNLDEALLTLTATDGTDSGSISSISVRGDGAASGTSDSPEPHRRVCNNLTTNQESETVAEFTFIDAYMGVNIARYYNGSTASEANFVGYGIATGVNPNSSFGIDTAFIVAEALADGSESFYHLGGTVDSGSFGSPAADNEGYVTISGIPFCYASAANGTTVTATATEATSIDVDDETAAGPVTLSFYTYT